MHKRLIAVLAAAALAGAAALPVFGEADVTAPPPGIKAAPNTTLREILRSNALADGRAESPVSIEQWSVSFGGVSSIRHEVRHGDDYRVDETRAGLHTAYGESGGTGWDMNENGQVVTESGFHRRDETSARALHKATDASKDVRLLGAVASPVDAYVVRVAPEGGRLEYRFYDRRSFLLDRIEQVREGRRESIVFSDYRMTGGAMRPWRIVFDDGRPNNVRTEVMQAFQSAVPLDRDATAMPKDQRRLIAFDSDRLTLPAKIVDDRIILPFHVDGHTINFQLDSGASGIVIDDAIVRALKIPEIGRVTGETAGEYVESSVTIPKMTIGSLTLDNVAARSLPFANLADDRSPIAGLMGFDLIESAVVHIDYVDGTVELLDPAHFSTPADAVALPIVLDDRVPMTTATIGGAQHLQFMIDTGADRSLLFTQFASAHAAELRDQGLGTALQGASPFYNDFYGVGGSVEYQPVQVGNFGIGRWSFPKWLFYLTHDAPAFESEDYDGLIGQDVLRNYDVYLDYTHQRVYLQPNKRYRDRWG